MIMLCTWPLALLLFQAVSLGVAGLEVTIDPTREVTVHESRTSAVICKAKYDAGHTVLTRFSLDGNTLDVGSTLLSSGVFDILYTGTSSCESEQQCDRFVAIIRGVQAVNGSVLHCYSIDIDTSQMQESPTVMISLVSATATPTPTPKPTPVATTATTSTTDTVSTTIATVSTTTATVSTTIVTPTSSPVGGEPAGPTVSTPTGTPDDSTGTSSAGAVWAVMKCSIRNCHSGGSPSLLKGSYKLQ